MLNFHSTPTSDYQSIHLSVEPEEELDEKSKIPFNFLHIPYRLIDEDIIASLDGNSVKVLNVISRYLDLREQIIIGKRVLLFGCGIPISYEHIAKKSGISKRTVIRKVKILVEREIIQVKKVGRCNCYRLTEYAICLEVIDMSYQEQMERDKAASEQRTTSEQQSQPRQSSHQATGHQTTETEHQTPVDEPVIKPGVPTDDRLEQLIQRQIVTTLSPLIDELVSRLTPSKEHGIKETLSEQNQYEGKKSHEVKTPSLSISQLKALHPDWEEYQKYAKTFYGNIPSKKLLINACVYFEEKVNEYGICDDGFDTVMEMIPVIKQFGARTHKAFDTEYGIRAFNKVIDDRDYQLQQKASQQQQPSSPNDNSNEPQTHSANEQPFEDDQPSDSPSDVLRHVRHATQRAPRRPAHVPTSAKQAVAGQVYGRHCLASIGQGEPYTNCEIEALWEKAYQRFGQPQSPEAWVDDRIDLRDRLVDKGIREPYTDLEIDELRQKAAEVFGEISVGDAGDGNR